MKKEYRIKSNAKINLELGINGKLETGYHDLSMINIPINLFDTMNIEINSDSNKISIIDINNSGMPVDESNLIYKTINAFKEEENIEFSIVVKIYKEIPMESGTGGASSNSAEILKCLYKHFNISYKNQYLVDKYKYLGADIPFFIYNQPAKVYNIGDIVLPINNFLKKYYFVLIHPNFKESTKEIYSNIERYTVKKDLDQLIEEMKNENFTNLQNDFFHIVQKNNKYDKIIKDLTKYEPDYINITGTGSTIFAILRKEKNSKKISNELQLKYKNVYICQGIGDNYV